MSSVGISMPSGTPTGGQAPLLNRKPTSINDDPRAEDTAGRRVRQWGTAQGAAWLSHLLLGVALCVWALVDMGGIHTQTSAMVLGGTAATFAVVGLAGTVNSVLSTRTMHVIVAGFIGLMALSFVRELTMDIENDCFMAEAMTRIDHLEESLMKVKHEELLQSVFTRLQLMHDDISDVEKGSIDIADTHMWQKTIAQQDTDLVDNKMERLRSLAKAAHEHAEEELLKITLKTEDTAGMIDSNKADPAAVKKLQATLTGLERRETSLKRKEEAIRSVLREHDNLEDDDSVDGVAYKNNLLKLLRNVVDPDLGGEIRRERDEAAETQDALDRLHANEYHLLDVNGFQERNAERQLKRRAAKLEFEEHVQSVLKNHTNNFATKDKFVASLKTHLDNLPEICLRELKNNWIGVWMAYGLMVGSAVGGFTALNAAVLQAALPGQ